MDAGARSSPRPAWRSWGEDGGLVAPTVFQATDRACGVAHGVHGFRVVTTHESAPVAILRAPARLPGAGGVLREPPATCDTHPRGTSPSGHSGGHKKGAPVGTSEPRAGSTDRAHLDHVAQAEAGRSPRHGEQPSAGSRWRSWVGSTTRIKAAHPMPSVCTGASPGGAEARARSARAPAARHGQVLRRRR